MDDLERAELLQFQLDNNSYNMQLYDAVCKACGIDTSDMDAVFEDYQSPMIILWKCREIRRLEEEKVAEVEWNRVLCLWGYLIEGSSCNRYVFMCKKLLLV